MLFGRKAVGLNWLSQKKVASFRMEVLIKFWCERFILAGRLFFRDQLGFFANFDSFFTLLMSNEFSPVYFYHFPDIPGTFPIFASWNSIIWTGFFFCFRFWQYCRIVPAQTILRHPEKMKVQVQNFSGNTVYCVMVLQVISGLTEPETLPKVKWVVSKEWKSSQMANR